MIFDEKSFCTVTFCRDVRGQDALQLPYAPLVVLVLSTGKAALAGASAPVLGRAGSVVLAKGLLRVTPAENCHVLAVGLDGSMAGSVQVEDILISDGTVCPMAAQLVRDIAEAHGKARPTGALAYSLLCETAHADAAAPTLPPLVADAVLAITENYAGLYGVEELSTQLGVSKSHLVRVFSAAMGTPPGQYLTRVRVAAAKQLLAQREYTLEVVATLSGFANANYFCKVFKKETGQTPNAFRAAAVRQPGGKSLHNLEDMLYV